MTTEPMCCGEPMVHNTWTGENECAEAYFRLLDDGVLGDVAQRSNISAMNDFQRGRYEHWLASCIPCRRSCCSDAATGDASDSTSPRS